MGRQIDVAGKETEISTEFLFHLVGKMDD